MHEGDTVPPRYEDLLPLVGLVARSNVRLNQVLDDVVTGDVRRLASRFDNPDVAVDCLERAGAVDATGRFRTWAHAVLFASFALREDRKTRQRWTPVLTVPDYLRPYLPEGGFTETTAVLRRLVLEAEHRLVLASPFLDDGIRSLLPGIASHVDKGGECLLITRDLLEVGDRGRNRRTVDELRNRVRRREGLRISWWGGSNLGVHLKVAIADDATAYVGSANFTRGGLGEHLEVGVLLEGPGVEELAALLERAATALDETHVWQAP